MDSPVLMIQFGNLHINASSLKSVTGGPAYCETVYQDFIFEFWGAEAAKIWAWWQQHGSRR
jgi:hypothetical protein